jgi:hypothetical protein
VHISSIRHFDTMNATVHVYKIFIIYKCVPVTRNVFIFNTTFRVLQNKLLYLLEQNVQQYYIT